MHSMLEALNLPERHDRLADLITNYAGWFTDMEPPSDDYRRLYIQYAKLAIAKYLRDKCRDCPVGLQELTKLITVRPAPPHHDHVPFEPADIAEYAVVEMMKEGYAEEHHTDGFGPLYVVNDEPAKSPYPDAILPSSLDCQMREWAALAIAAAGQIDARRSRVARRHSPPSRDALLCRDLANTLNALLAEPTEWVFCLNAYAAWWLANEGVVERDGQGRYRVVDVERARDRLGGLIAASKPTNGNPP